MCAIEASSGICANNFSKFEGFDRILKQIFKVSWKNNQLDILDDLRQIRFITMEKSWQQERHDKSYCVHSWEAEMTLATWLPSQ